MVRRRHATERLNLERLEARRLLAIERPFVEHVWESTLGDVSTIAVIADLDGDEVDDIVATADPSRPSSAWYKLNSAKDRFEFAGLLPSVDINTRYTPIVAADFDSDEDLDLLIELRHIPGPDAFSTYSWLENVDGRGTFGSTFHPIIEHWNIVTWVDVADLDMDGDWDLAYSGSWSPEAADTGWAENVDGTFTYHVLVEGIWNDLSYFYDHDRDGVWRVPEVVSPPLGRKSVDLDGDGDLDWVFPEPYPLIGWLENVDGQATFARHILFDFQDEDAMLQPTDIDQDQDVDVWVQSPTDMFWLENDGFGTFEQHFVDFRVPGELHLMDLDGNGSPEPVGFDMESGQLAWFDFDPETFDFAEHSARVPRGDVAQALADMNGDGILDLVGREAWYEQTDALSSFVRHDYALGRRLDVAAPMDVDSNGEIDLVIAWNTDLRFRPNSQLSWFQRTGLRVVEFPIASNLTIAIDELRPLDLDLDGDMDLLTISSGALNWWENADGRGSFISRGRYLNRSVQSIWHVADMDGDGDMDVVYTNNDALLWQENRDGAQLGSHTLIDASNGMSLGPFVVDDVDSDGDLDVVITREETIAWHENAGEGNFPRPETEIARMPSIHSMHAADLNGDGDLDLVVGSDVTPDETDLLYVRPHRQVTYSFFDNQDGRGQFARVENTLENRGILAVVGDINGDGAAELFESPREIAGIIIHENVTPTEVVPGDINQDGSLDVVDVDQFCLARSSGDVDSRLDIDSDGQVTHADFEYLVEQLAGLKYGDASLDGDFDSSDLVWVLQRGHYEDGVPANSDWQDGDWNCDREFSTADLVVALQHGDYGQVVQDRFLLVAHRETDQVLSFDAATGEFVAEFASLESPLDIAVGPDGDVYVAQQTDPLRISRYRADGQFVSSIQLGSGPEISYLAFGPDGNLYVSYFVGRRIERFSVDNDDMVSLGDIVPPDALKSISVDAFEVGPDGDLYLAVRQTDSIWRFSGPTWEMDGFASAPRPEGMAFGPDGDLYVGSGEFGGGQVRRYDGTSGELVDVLIDEIPYIYGRIDPVFTDDGYLLLSIADHAGLKIHRYDALTGEWIDVLVGEGEVGLEFPADIALLSV